MRKLNTRYIKTYHLSMQFEWLSRLGTIGSICSLINSFTSQKVFLNAIFLSDPSRTLIFLSLFLRPLTVNEFVLMSVSFSLEPLLRQGPLRGQTKFGWILLNMRSLWNWMEHQGDRKRYQCDLTNLKYSQVFHLGVEEETSRSCSLHLHVLLDAASVIKENTQI